MSPLRSKHSSIDMISPMLESLFSNLIIQSNLYFLSSMLASSALDEQNRFLLLVNDADYAELRTAEQMLYKNVDAYLLNSPEHGYSSFDSTLDLYIKTQGQS